MWIIPGRTTVDVKGPRRKVAANRRSAAEGVKRTKLPRFARVSGLYCKSNEMENKTYGRSVYVLLWSMPGAEANDGAALPVNVQGVRNFSGGALRVSRS